MLLCLGLVVVDGYTGPSGTFTDEQEIKYLFMTLPVQMTEIYDPSTMTLSHLTVCSKLNFKLQCDNVPYQHNPETRGITAPSECLQHKHLKEKVISRVYDPEGQTIQFTLTVSGIQLLPVLKRKPEPNPPPPVVRPPQATPNQPQDSAVTDLDANGGRVVPMLSADNTEANRPPGPTQSTNPPPTQPTNPPPPADNTEANRPPPNPRYTGANRSPRPPPPTNRPQDPVVTGLVICASCASIVTLLLLVWQSLAEQVWSRRQHKRTLPVRWLGRHGSARAAATEAKLRFTSRWGATGVNSSPSQTRCPGQSRDV